MLAAEEVEGGEGEEPRDTSSIRPAPAVVAAHLRPWPLVRLRVAQDVEHEQGHADA